MFFSFVCGQESRMRKRASYQSGAPLQRSIFTTHTHSHHTHSRTSPHTRRHTHMPSLSVSITYTSVHTGTHTVTHMLHLTHTRTLTHTHTHTHRHMNTFSPFSWVVRKRERKKEQKGSLLRLLRNKSVRDIVSKLGNKR